jgi:hypothetical protein
VILLGLLTGRLRTEDHDQVQLTGSIQLAELARVFPGY